MKWKLFTFASALSVLLATATMAAWVLSFWNSVAIQAQWTAAVPRPDGELPLKCTIRLRVDRGNVTMVSWRDTLSNLLDLQTGRLDPVHREPVAFTWMGGRANPTWACIGGQWANIHHRAWLTDHAIEAHFVSIPLWAVTAALGALSVVFLFPLHRRRVMPGRCSDCGHDLRASTGRCPECGTPIAIGVAAEHRSMK